MVTKKGNISMCIYTHLFAKPKIEQIRLLTGAHVIGAEYEHPKDAPRRFIRFIFRKQPS